MTAHELQALSEPALERLWLTLRADKLPVGTYDGWVKNRPWWPAYWRLWRGKVFESCACCPECRARWVLNRIGPFLRVRGDTLVKNGEVLVDYPQLKLQDRLRPVSATPELWLGRLLLRGKTIWFTLEAVG